MRPVANSDDSFAFKFEEGEVLNRFVEPNTGKLDIGLFSSICDLPKLELFILTATKDEVAGVGYELDLLNVVCVGSLSCEHGT